MAQIVSAKILKTQERLHGFGTGGYWPCSYCGNLILMDVDSFRRNQKPQVAYRRGSERTFGPFNMQTMASEAFESFLQILMMRNQGVGEHKNVVNVDSSAGT